MNQKTTKKLTVTDVRKMMRELSYDPRKPGHLKPIVDAGNSDYYITRSAEMLLEARSLPNGAGRRKQNIENAITLLSLALWYSNNDVG